MFFFLPLFPFTAFTLLIQARTVVLNTIETEVYSPVLNDMQRCDCTHHQVFMQSGGLSLSSILADPVSCDMSVPRLHQRLPHGLSLKLSPKRLQLPMTLAGEACKVICFRDLFGLLVSNTWHCPDPLGDRACASNDFEMAGTDMIIVPVNFVTFAIVFCDKIQLLKTDSLQFR